MVRILLLVLLIACGAPVAIEAAIKDPPPLATWLLFLVVLIVNELIQPDHATDP